MPGLLAVVVDSEVRLFNRRGRGSKGRRRNRRVGDPSTPCPATHLRRPQPRPLAHAMEWSPNRGDFWCFPEPSQNAPADGGPEGPEDLSQWSGDLFEGSVEVSCDSQKGDALWDMYAYLSSPTASKKRHVATPLRSEARTPQVRREGSEGGTPVMARQGARGCANLELPLTAPSPLRAFRAALVAEGSTVQSLKCIQAAASGQQAHAEAAKAGGPACAADKGGAKRRRLAGKHPTENAPPGQHP